jgi:outer membrane protein TolC
MSKQPKWAVPFAVFFAALCSSVWVRAQNPLPSPTPPSSPAIQSVTPVSPLTLDNALRLANAQASTYQTAILNERIAAEDVKQAQAAFLPKVSAPLGYIYTSPALGLPPGEPRGPSFVTSDGIGVYDGLVNVSGDFDIGGKLRATLARNRALLAAAHAGAEVARRALAQAVVESYFGLALAIAQRQAAEENLKAAEDFEQITSLLLSGGEVAPVDVTRAELQTLTRRDALEHARVDEQVAASALRVLVGYEFSRPIVTTDLALAVPTTAEYEQFKADDVSRRAEFIQFEQQLRAARADITIARADRLPALSYSINGGFDTDSLKSPRLKQHTGMSAGMSLSIPIFDWGASRSRERQARLQAEATENERTLALRGFTQQFYAARAQAVSASARINLAREGVLKAQKNLTASIARYRAGEAQIVEVTDAQTTLVEQRSALYQAIFDYQTALARLKQATGQ